jgi:hypothetical protein
VQYTAVPKKKQKMKPHTCVGVKIRETVRGVKARGSASVKQWKGVPFPTTHHLNWTSIQHAQLEHAAGEQGLHAAERDTHRSLAEEWPRWGAVSAGSGSQDKECPHARGLGPTEVTRQSPVARARTANVMSRFNSCL